MNQLKMTVTHLELQVSLTDVAELRIKLLLKKSEGKATESDFKQLNRLAELMRTTSESVSSEDDKKFLEYAEKMIAALESKPNLSNDPTDLDFSDSK